MIEFIQELLRTIYDVEGIIQWGGTLLVCTIVFVETGLFVGFFLPGDSLLFALGALSATPGTTLELKWLMATLIVAGILGDSVNYSIGKYLGPKVFREKSRWFRRDYLL